MYSYKIISELIKRIYFPKKKIIIDFKEEFTIYKIRFFLKAKIYFCFKTGLHPSKYGTYHIKWLSNNC